MKLPKTVNICGKIYKVRKDPKSYDGGGTTARCEMTVGTKNKNPERQFEIFLHEVMEIAAVEKDYRYHGGNDADLLFVMSHKEFDNYTVDVASAIRPMIK
ncbi:hypothetical protein LCGC14_3017380 [marine sediment metagenome]|uniref:Uncharacterized protein n=1 Tax=marine sediment metagenome TaxID=412755 RepID=A0A0F8Z3Z7_9ZZZZ